ncbi:YkgJ family cysteine cluster protein [Sphingomonas abietis]|uniref:YkgJ family cysteine cluster protein n=1 Tax=Sphingomonas abietis TaxID=3012344 RepID=A0ABY7NN55_9SPHN|nr:YkgJ family cysteine cluster protein [Sphingomonas abietis]WBO22260.1 YkgJ family cysteine cluster protein [Sphingomonas abietis]
MPMDLETTIFGPLVADRDCGDCTVCCETLRIDTPDLRKPANTRCTHLGAQGCTIHAVRPDICRAWFCGWRRAAAMPDAARPDRSGLLVSLDFVRAPRNVFEGVAIVIRSLVGRAVFGGAAAAELIDGLCDQMVPVWIHDGEKKVLVHPEDEVANLVLSGAAPPAHLRAEVAAWRRLYGVFGE